MQFTLMINALCMMISEMIHLSVCILLANESWPHTYKSSGVSNSYEKAVGKGFSYCISGVTIGVIILHWQYIGGISKFITTVYQTPQNLPNPNIPNTTKYFAKL